MIVWITGLSGAGKTTLSQALAHILKPRLPNLVVIDGDVVRELFEGDLDYSVTSRRKQIQRIQGLAFWLEAQGIVVVVAALYSAPDLLQWNRTNFHSYFEIYIEAPLDFLRGRDTKALYARAYAGEARDVVGVDIMWHAPERSDFRVKAIRQEAPDVVAKNIVRAIPELRASVA